MEVVGVVLAIGLLAGFVAWLYYKLGYEAGYFDATAREVETTLDRIARKLEW